MIAPLNGPTEFIIQYWTQITVEYILQIFARCPAVGMEEAHPQSIQSNTWNTANHGLTMEAYTTLNKLLPRICTSARLNLILLAHLCRQAVGIQI